MPKTIKYTYKNFLNGSKSESGQTIAAVVIIMVIALSIGMTISTRFIRQLRQSVQQDTSSRALSVAEAAMERMLNTDYQTLLDYISFNNCGSSCTLQITGADGVVADANVVLSIAGGSSQAFELGLTTDNTVEISLAGYPSNTDLSVCWNNPITGEYPSIRASLVYGIDGSYLAKSYAYNSIGSLYDTNGFNTANAANGYANCFTVDSGSNPNFLRLASIYNDATVFILPNSGTNLPSQGIKIVSTGTAGSSQRKVTVLITSPHLPAPFDYVIFSKSMDNPLSN
ncbi:hypothetical protein HYV31_01350 [candidate division WWE3 bacterium]|nr:hypothetical protein [candidate division WWE3 bacterium]